MKLYTIGFTKKTAPQFFGLLAANGVRRVVDVRLNNTSQLARMAIRDDLPYYLADPRVGAEYLHLPELAPTPELLRAYRAQEIDWDAYAGAFEQLMAERRIESCIQPDLLPDACLLCSEHPPERCHRRLVAEYLREAWGGIEIIHLQ